MRISAASRGVAGKGRGGRRTRYVDLDKIKEGEGCGGLVMTEGL